MSALDEYVMTPPPPDPPDPQAAPASASFSRPDEFTHSTQFPLPGVTVVTGRIASAPLFAAWRLFAVVSYFSCPFVVAVALAAVGTCVAVMVPVPDGPNESPDGTSKAVMMGPILPNRLVMAVVNVPHGAPASVVFPLASYSTQSPDVVDPVESCASAPFPCTPVIAWE